jgi:THO complex subunit 7
MSLTTNEDDIIKKRLLIEGDSGNEDRCINKLIKIFVKWSNSSAQLGDDGDVVRGGHQNNDDDMTGPNAHEMMIALLSHIKFGLMRNELILEMNKLEQDNYDSLYKNIDTDISNAKQDIVKYKIELQQARKIRKNRQEYDILAKEILKYANREELESSIQRLNSQLDDLKEVKNSLNHKIDVRRKQFSVVLNSLHTLKGLIDHEQYDDNDTCTVVTTTGNYVDSIAMETTNGSNNKQHQQHDEDHDVKQGTLIMSDIDDDLDDAQSVNSDRQYPNSDNSGHNSKTKRIKLDMDNDNMDDN